MTHVPVLGAGGTGLSGDPAGWDLRRCHVWRGWPQRFDLDAAWPGAADRARCRSARGSAGASDRRPAVDLRARQLSRLTHVLDRCEVDSVDGVLFDLGVSSMQFDDVAARLLAREGGAAGHAHGSVTPVPSAYDVLDHRERIANSPTSSLITGEERAARRIAHAIVARRSRGTLPSTTTEFAPLVAGVVHRPGRRERIHPATRVFQALAHRRQRRTGRAARRPSRRVGRLRGAGRVVPSAFIRSKIASSKQTFRDDERLDVLTKRPDRPGEREIAENPRARSAKLRAAQRKAS